MSEQEIKIQIAEINTKLDLVLQYVEQQRLKTQQVEDLVNDVVIVGNDVFKTAIQELEHNNVELDVEQIKSLLVRLVKNIGNINQAMAMFESMNDLMLDLGPILQRMSFDFIQKIEEFENKGYFEILENLSKNSDSIVNSVKLITQPSVLQSFEKIVKISTSMKIDDEKDNKSLFKLFKEISKPEVRKSLSFSLRMLQEIQKELK